MWRSILAVVAGTVVAIMLIGLLDMVNHAIYPPPAAVAEAAERQDMQAVAAAVKEWLPHAPLGALVLIPTAWIVATFVGSLVAGLIANRARIVHALLAGVMPLVGTAMALRMIPHPAWVAIAGLAGVPLAALLAGLLAARMLRPAGPQPYDVREKNMAC